SNLRDRINTGRKLYFGALLFDPIRIAGIERWATRIFHDGSRNNYDSAHYTLSPVLLSLPEGKISSKALSPGLQPRWPGPPPSTIPTWSTLPGRLSIFSSSLPLLSID